VLELAMTLAQHFAAYSEWRASSRSRLGSFSGWLVENELTDAQTDRRIVRLLEKLREDRLHVAFVAEFSRGKSELINAIFFAGYGNRILPSTAGRTTMCPTELMFDASKPPAIELLPIESRESNDQHQRVQALSRRVDRSSRSTPLRRRPCRRRLRHVSDVIRVAGKVAEGSAFIVPTAIRPSFASIRTVASRSPLAARGHQFPASAARSRGW
jgi:hypothetical protein